MWRDTLKVHANPNKSLTPVTGQLGLLLVDSNNMRSYIYIYIAEELFIQLVPLRSHKVLISSISMRIK